MDTVTLREPKMGWVPILQVALLNIAVTLAILPLDSTLNRVMITELGISATLVALLIALRFLTSPLRIWFGRLSDTRPLWGKHRTGYIGIGMVLMAVGFVLTPYAAFAIPGGGAGALLFAVLAFALLGFGVNMTTPLYFAIVSDQSSERQRPRIVALMFILLGIVVVVGAFGLGALLDPYSDARLINIFWGVAAGILILTVIGLVGLEKNSARTAAADAEPSFAAVKDLLLGNREVGRFFVYLVLTFVAIEAQEIILEPYAAAAFDMTPGETTRLTGIFRVGQLVMLAVGAWIVNRFGYRSGALLGIVLAALSFVLIILAGGRGISGAFMGGVLMLGLGAGALVVTNLSLMMNMTSAQHAGVFLGAWGFAQAVGVGSGTLIGGLLRDVGAAIFSNDLASYYLVYGFEIVLLLLAIPLVRQLDLGRFREDNAKLTVTEAYGGAGL